MKRPFPRFEVLGLTAALALVSSCSPNNSVKPGAPVLTGSHMDTQPNGGRFDGIYGVIAGLEALTALHDTGIQLRRPL